MSANAADLLQRVLEIADRVLDAKRIAQAKQRQADMFAWRRTDYTPILFGRNVPEFAGMPDFDWTQQFEDPAASLYMQMRGQVTACCSGADHVPAVRADTGVVNGPSILGAPYQVPPHTKPVVCGHVSREVLDAFEVPDDITPLGTMPIMIRHTRHHVRALKAAGLWGRVGIHHCDLQGPFDIIAQARGHDDIFLDLYTDADLVRRLMAKGVKLFIQMATLCKRLVGDPMTSGHANEYWSGHGSVRLCDDSGILVGPELYAEHLADAIGQALAPFGGGWIHYCGGVPDGNRPEGLHLHDIYFSQPGLLGLQFTTARDWPGEVARTIRRKKVYPAGLPRPKDETLEQHFRRVLALTDNGRGMIYNAPVREGEHDGAVELWHKVQDEMFPSK